VNQQNVGCGRTFLLGVKRQSKLLLHDPGEEAPHRVRLPASDLRNGRNGGTVLGLERDANPSIREGALIPKLLPKRVVVTDETSSIVITIDGDCTMRHKGLRVRIIGAGTGGLCLAQGLKQDDVEAEVFECDHTPTDRLQGYV